MDWSKISLISSDSITHEIEGHGLCDFYPISVWRLGKIKKVASELAKSIATLTTDMEGEAGSHTVSNANGTNEFVRMPKSEQLSALHAREKHKAIDSLTTVFLEEKNMEEIACLVMESMRGEFEGFKDADARDFVKKVPMPTFVAMIIGMMKANRGIFGPFAKKTIQRVEDRLQNLVNNPMDDEDEAELASDSELPTESPNSDASPQASEQASVSELPTATSGPS